MSIFRRRSPRVPLVAACAFGALLAGCAGSAPGGPTPGEEPAAPIGVQVDSPELRAAKERAGIADCPPPSDPAPEGDATLPAVTLPCLGGGRDVDLSALRGPMVVNLWAQWCGPCREELPYYQRLHEAAGDRVRVLGVDYQDTRPDWAIDLLGQSGVTYPSVADPAGELRAPLRVRGLPAVLLVDGSGDVVHREFVVIESYGQLADLVEKHLGVAVGAAG